MARLQHQLTLLANRFLSANAFVVMKAWSVMPPQFLKTSVSWLRCSVFFPAYSGLFAHLMLKSSMLGVCLAKSSLLRRPNTTVPLASCKRS